MRKGARLGVRASLAALMGALALVVFGAGAARADTVVRTFTYTGALQTFTAPPDVVGPLTIRADGAQGGASALAGGSTGRGASITTTVAAQPGQVYTILVGGQGGVSTNGGGGGGSFVWTSDTYGTASPVVFDGQDLLVAAGGGGGAGCKARIGADGASGPDGTPSPLGTPGGSGAGGGSGGAAGFHGGGGGGGGLLGSGGNG